MSLFSADEGWNFEFSNYLQENRVAWPVRISRSSVYAAVTCSTVDRNTIYVRSCTAARNSNTPYGIWSQVNDRTSAIYRTAGGPSSNCRICSNTWGITTLRWSGRRTGRSTATSAARASPRSPASVPTRRRSVMYVPNPTSNSQIRWYAVPVYSLWVESKWRKKKVKEESISTIARIYFRSSNRSSLTTEIFALTLSRATLRQLLVTHAHDGGGFTLASILYTDGFPFKRSLSTVSFVPFRGLPGVIDVSQAS